MTNRRVKFLAVVLIMIPIVATIVLVNCQPAKAVTPNLTITTAAASKPAVRLSSMTHAPACPAGAQVVVIGDSITALGAPILRERLTAAGYLPLINARGGRTIAEGWEVVWGFGEEKNLRRCWVIALGTNDTFYSTPDRYAYDALKLLSYIPAGELVWWVPVAVAGGELINGMVATVDPLVPATLTGWAPSVGDLMWDGVHTSEQGRVRWADSVMAALA